MIGSAEIPEEIRIFSRYGHIRGLYGRDRSALSKGLVGPVYQHRRNWRNLQLPKDKQIAEVFLIRDGGRWLVRCQRNDQRYFCKSDPVPSDDPRQMGIQNEAWTDRVSCIEAVNHDEVGNSALDRLEVHSSHSSMECGLIRRSKEELVWASDDSNVFFWHCREEGKDGDDWYITDNPPNSEYTLLVKVPACGSDDPRKADWAHGVWKSGSPAIESLSSVWWDDYADESPHHWTDPDFPHVLPGNEEHVWIHAHHLSRDPPPEDLFKEISPDHVRQGSLGDCWLMAAVAALAEFPKAIENLFPHGKTHLPKDGKMELRLFDIREGEWTSVIVDAFIPCKPRKWYQEHAEPIFCKPLGNELWVLYLEKALAKFFGSYGHLRENSPCIAWQAMTGARSQFMYRKISPNSWQKMTSNVEEQQNKFQANQTHEISFRTCPNSSELEDDEVWKRLCKTGEGHYGGCSLLGAAINELTPDGAQIDDINDKLLENGLVANHVYTVLKVRTAGKSGEYRFVELRNPWGSGCEWNGPWNPQALEWLAHPELAKELDIKPHDDGSFWMPFVEFAKVFTSLYVCPMATGLPYLPTTSMRQRTRTGTGVSAGGTSVADEDSGSECWESESRLSATVEDVVKSFQEHAKRQGIVQAFEVTSGSQGVSDENCVERCTASLRRERLCVVL